MEYFLKYLKNMYDEEKRIKLIESFLTSPIKLAVFLLLAVLFISFVIYYPCYGSGDDPVMTIIASGGINPAIGPSEFLLYSNILYGKILKTLYLMNNNIDWYDLLCYFFQSIALFVTAFTIFDKKKIGYNIFVFIVFLGVYTSLFLEEQFTTYTGSLVISAICACIYMLKNNLKKYQYIVFGGYVISILSLASIVRFNAFCIILFFGSLCSLFIVKKDEIKKLFGIILLLLFSCSLAYIMSIENDNIIKNNPEFREYAAKNEIRAALHDNSIAGNDVVRPWMPVEMKLNNIEEKLSQVGWTKGDYRLLLTWSHIGDKDIFTLEKMKKLANILKKDISISNNLNLQFNIADHHKCFFIYILILVLSIVFFIKPSQYLRPALIILLFFALETLLNINFRQTPYRLWINFIIISLVTIYSYLKYSSIDFMEYYGQKFDKNILKHLNIVTLILAFYFSVGLINSAHNISRPHVKAYNMWNEILKDYSDPGKTYIITPNALEASKLPFQKSIFATNRKIIFITMGFFLQSKKMLDLYNIPKTETWKYICSHDNIEFMISKELPYYDFLFDAEFLAIHKHMEDGYNKNITFVEEQNLNGIKTYSCKFITKEDIEWAKRIKKYQSISRFNLNGMK